MPFNVTANIPLPALSDKVGAIMITLARTLAAGGAWRIRGSGDGRGAYQLMGQTAGPSFDVFTSGAGYLTNVNSWYPFWGANSNPLTITNPRAWLVLEEIASGRCLTLQRCAGTNQYDPITISAAVSAGVANTGAGHSTPPALTGTSGWLIGNAFNTSNYFGGETADNGGNELNIGANIEHWMQVAVHDALFNTNVAPWWCAVWSRTQNKQVFGGAWEPLSDVDAAHAAQPFACALGAWSRVWGSNGIGWGEGGFGGTGSGWRGGAGFGTVAFERSYRNMGPDSNSRMHNTIGISPAAVQQIQSDSKYRTERPWCYQPAVGSRSLGRLTHFYVNKVARDYPTTYDVASSTPRIALGQLIGPWKQGTAPFASP